MTDEEGDLFESIILFEALTIYNLIKSHEISHKIKLKTKFK